MSDEMERLAEALGAAAIAYRNVANAEMNKGGAGYGSIDTIYNCVRNSRNLDNKARKAQQFGSTY